MKKIPCLFERDFSKRGKPVLLKTITKGCEWVLQKEGKATRKWDGTPVRIKDKALSKRYDCKTGRTPPDNFEPCIKEPDSITGHWPGWIPVGEHDKWIIKAFENSGFIEDGTYEAVGPKINSNHDKLDEHTLKKHGDVSYEIPDISWDGLKDFLENKDIEGIVFHHPDGRMCKIKRENYGIPWPILAAKEV